MTPEARVDAALRILQSAPIKLGASFRPGHDGLLVSERGEVIGELEGAGLRDLLRRNPPPPDTRQIVERSIARGYTLVLVRLDGDDSGVVIQSIDLFAADEAS